MKFRTFLKEHQDRVFDDDFDTQIHALSDIYNYDVINGIVSISNNDHLTDLSGFPRKIGGSAEFIDCKNLTSLEGDLMEIFGSLGIFNCQKVVSLSGIGKRYVKRIYGSAGGPFSKSKLYIPNSIKSSVLGILLIRDLSKVLTSEDMNSGITHITSILNTYIKDKDLISAKEELMAAGYKEYAKL